MPPEQDIPYIDEHVSQLPSDLREDLADLGRRDLMFLAKGVLGFRDMTQRCHGPLCQFVTGNKSQFKLMLHPRDTFKTSTVTISGNVQKVINNTEERILIANESATNSERWLGVIQNHAESNRIFRALYSDIIPRDTRKVPWNASELVFNRQGHYPEPTLDAIGMTGAVTSRHYTHICFDDPISEEAVKSELVMQDVITRMSALTSLLVEPDKNTVWLVGTRWALFDVYSWFEKAFALRLSKFARSIMEDGESIFPERFPPEILAIKRGAMGEYRYSCLMMNNPHNIEVQDLNVDDLKYFRWIDDGSAVELLSSSGSPERRVSLNDLSITVTVDLAPAERVESDRNAVAVAGVTPWSEVVVLEAWGKRCTPLELIEELFRIQQRYHPRVYGIEDVAYQKAFKYFLQSEALRRGLYLRIEGLRAQGKKEIRIRGLQPIMAIGRLYIDPKQHMLRDEMADFPLGQYDDVVDALSMQTQLFRGRLSPEHMERLDKEASLLRDDSQLRKELDLDPDEEIDREFLPQSWTDYVIYS